MNTGGTIQVANRATELEAGMIIFFSNDDGSGYCEKQVMHKQNSRRDSIMKTK